MNVAVIGSGGREHALCFQLLKSIEIENLFCIPGNAGTNNICHNIDIDYLNFELLYSILQENDIKVVIVGPEIPLVAGIVDYLSEKNIYAFGPSKKASQLEGSKAFMKKLCKDFNIPTAKYEEFDNFDEAKNFIENNQHPLVIKADGLAAGKGVVVSSSLEESNDAIDKFQERIKDNFFNKGNNSPENSDDYNDKMQSYKSINIVLGDTQTNLGNIILNDQFDQIKSQTNINKLAIIKKIKESCEAMNDASYIGTLELMDKVSKMYTTNVICDSDKINDGEEVEFFLGDLGRMVSPR